MNARPLQIAIDGPVASGKGEIAARLAKELNLLYIYTGGMYRALAIACIQNDVSMKDEEAVRALLVKQTITVEEPTKDSPHPYIILLNGKDVTSRISDPDVAQGASDVGVLPTIRSWMVDRQKQLAQDKRVVMEGRDIGLRVLPDAQLKIYLTATAYERARRRFAQWQAKGIQVSIEETLVQIKLRDAQDMGRTTDPLQKVVDAWGLDTTDMGIDEVIQVIVNELKKRGLV